MSLCFYVIDIIRRLTFGRSRGRGPGFIITPDNVHYVSSVCEFSGSGLSPSCSHPSARTAPYGPAVFARRLRAARFTPETARGMAGFNLGRLRRGVPVAASAGEGQNTAAGPAMRLLQPHTELDRIIRSNASWAASLSQRWA